MKKNSKKRLLINLVTTLCMVCMLVTTFTTTAFAATQLSSVSVTFEKTTSDGKAPKVTATKSGTQLQEVVWEKEFSKYKPGDIARATVKLTTQSGYYFRDNYSKSNIKITNASLVSYDYKDGDLWIKVKYNVGGKLSSPENLKWESKNPGRARWDKVENADSYTIVLVRGNKTKKITGVRKNYYDFDELLLSDTYFDRSNVYFKVMAVPKSSSNLKNSDYNESEYFDYWDELYDERYESDWDGCRPPVPGYFTNGWHQDGVIWYYYENGKYVANCMKYIDGHKYSFDKNGRMRTGWYQDSNNSKWYYFNSASGEMLKGWQRIGNAWYFLKLESGEMIAADWYYDNGTWYYFDPSGAMATGWRYVDGYWYYLSASGAMVTGEQKIDGMNFYFAGNGTLQN